MFVVVMPSATLSHNLVKIAGWNVFKTAPPMLVVWAQVGLWLAQEPTLNRGKGDKIGTKIQGLYNVERIQMGQYMFPCCVQRNVSMNFDQDLSFKVCDGEVIKIELAR